MLHKVPEYEGGSARPLDVPLDNLTGMDTYDTRRKQVVNADIVDTTVDARIGASLIY